MIKIAPRKTLIGIFQFLKEVRLEVKKITWPGLRLSLKYTGMVILFSVVVAIFLGTIDFLFTLVLNRLILF